MKILIFAPYYLPHIDGLGILIDDFCKKLSLRSFEIIVFTPHLPGNSPETEIPYENVKIIRFPAFYIVSNYPIPKIWKCDFWKKITFIFKSKNDVVISYMRFFIVTFFALIYSKIKKTKWIHIEHGSSFVTLSSKFKMLIARICDYTLGRVVFRFSDINISASSVVRDFIEKFDSRYSPIIFNSIDVEKIERAAPNLKVKNEYAGKVVISFVGRLYRWKGVENSIKIIKSLPKEIKNKLIFLIIGDGEDYDKLNQLICGNDPIKLLGELPHEEALGVLKFSDIYVHSAMPGGGLSGALLEAMCLGCSVVATPNEGARDVVINNRNGFLVENEREARERLIDLILDPDKRLVFGGNAMQTVKDNFNLDVIIKKYEVIFKSLSD
jgi:glycosyltransferase involved in cell wall biosynthesis